MVVSGRARIDRLFGIVLRYITKTLLSGLYFYEVIRVSTLSGLRYRLLSWIDMADTMQVRESKLVFIFRRFSTLQREHIVEVVVIFVVLIVQKPIETAVDIFKSFKVLFLVIILNRSVNYFLFLSVVVHYDVNRSFQFLHALD